MKKTQTVISMRAKKAANDLVQAAQRVRQAHMAGDAAEGQRAISDYCRLRGVYL